MFCFNCDLLRRLIGLCLMICANPDENSFHENFLELVAENNVVKRFSQSKGTFDFILFFWILIAFREMAIPAPFQLFISKVHWLGILCWHLISFCTFELKNQPIARSEYSQSNKKCPLKNKIYSDCLCTYVLISSLFFFNCFSQPKQFAYERHVLSWDVWVLHIKDYSFQKEFAYDETSRNALSSFVHSSSIF